MSEQQDRQSQLRAAVAAILFLASLLYAWQATTLRGPSRPVVVGPEDFPRYVGILMVLFSAAIVVREVRWLPSGRRQEGASANIQTEGDEAELERIESWRDAGLVLAALLVYVTVLPLIGFVLATMLFALPLASYFSEPGDRMRNMAWSAVATVGLWIGFTQLLSVPLP